jgi:subtilisin family serine protease
MSIGYGGPSRAVRSALQQAYDRGVVVLASAGNSGRMADQTRHAPYSFPADYPGVLAVAAASASGTAARFSSDNISVQLAAPGVSVPAQGRDGQYWLVSGTSPACALVAGVAALIKSAYPRLPPSLVDYAMTSTTRNRPRGGYTDSVGFGTVNAPAALAAARRLAHQEPAAGLAASIYFGGGKAAVPPAPVARRGPGMLVLFAVLAAASLALAVAAATRIIVARRIGARLGAR